MYQTGDGNYFVDYQAAQQHCDAVYRNSGIILELKRPAVMYIILHEFDGRLQAIYSFCTVEKANELFDQIKTEDGFVEIYYDHPTVTDNETLRYATQGDYAELILITSTLRD